MRHFRQSNACSDSICILIRSALYQLTSIRSLGSDFTDWFAPFFSTYSELYFVRNPPRAKPLYLLVHKCTYGCHELVPQLVRSFENWTKHRSISCGYLQLHCLHCSFTFNFLARASFTRSKHINQFSDFNTQQPQHLPSIEERWPLIILRLICGNAVIDVDAISGENQSYLGVGKKSCLASFLCRAGGKKIERRKKRKKVGRSLFFNFYIILFSAKPQMSPKRKRHLFNAVILQIFGALKVWYQVMTERSVEFKFRCSRTLRWYSSRYLFSFRYIFNFGKPFDHRKYRNENYTENL